MPQEAGAHTRAEAGVDALLVEIASKQKHSAGRNAGLPPPPREAHHFHEIDVREKENIVVADHLVELNLTQAPGKSFRAVRQVIVRIRSRCGRHLLPIVEFENRQNGHAGNARARSGICDNERIDAHRLGSPGDTHRVAEVMTSCALQIWIKQIKTRCSHILPAMSSTDPSASCRTKR